MIMVRFYFQACTLNWVQARTRAPMGVCQTLSPSSKNGKGSATPDYPSLVPRPFYARGARWERDKGLVPVVRACVEFYWNPGKIVFFGIF